MSAPTVVFNPSVKKMVEALLALGTPKVMLATATYVPDQDLHDFANDITNEATGTSYSAGGITLTGAVANLDTTANTVTLDANDVTTAALSVVCRWAIVYVSTGTLSTSPVISYTDLSEGIGGNVTCTGIQWDALGIVPFAIASS